MDRHISFLAPAAAACPVNGATAFASAPRHAIAVIFFGLAVLGQASGARAQAITLQCDFPNGGGYVITIDYGSGMVVSHVARPYDGTTTTLLGSPTRAEIDSGHVGWAVPRARGNDSFTLNRSTGVLYLSRPNGDNRNYPCHHYVPPTPKF